MFCVLEQDTFFGKIFNGLLLRSGRRKGCSGNALASSVQHCTKSSSKFSMTRKGNKIHTDCKGRNKIVHRWHYNPFNM